MAASANFSTPIGYQTNLIVQGVEAISPHGFREGGLALELDHVLDLRVCNTYDMGSFRK